MDYFIDTMRPEDWSQVRSIYLEGMATGDSTFEAGAPDWFRWDSAHLPDHRLVARACSCTLGWAALSPVSDRCVYSGVAEVSLYVAAGQSGHGIGSALLAALIASSERAGIWTLQGGIFPDNEASLHLVRKHAFRRVGKREKLGKMTHGQRAGTWRDVILVERRSTVAGVD
jgi:L-amino acid N-acyltransferase YncA